MQEAGHDRHRRPMRQPVGAPQLQLGGQDESERIDSAEELVARVRQYS